MAEVRRPAMNECEYTPDLYRAELSCTDVPPAMKVGRLYRVTVDVRNDSSVAWAVRGRGVPCVRIAYHWIRASGEMYHYDGFRTDLPHTLRPGDVTRVPATVAAPSEPGRFVLQWDPVIEDVSWFSAHGWRGPEIEVRVAEKPGA